MNTRLIVIIAAVVVVVAGAGIATYYLLQDDDPVTGTYSYSYTMLDEPIGFLVDEDNNIVVNFDYWEGQDSDLFTTWSSDMEVLDNDPMAGTYWYLATITVHTDPGVTITADDIKWSIDETDALYLENPESYGYVTPYFHYNGQVLHSSYTTTTAVTDSNGDAQITALIFSDGIHRVPTILNNIEWTLKTS